MKLKKIALIFSIIFILFISIFAADVFAEYKFPLVLVALFMHLIPSFILIILLVVAMKKEKLGGILFLILAVIFTIWFRAYDNWYSLALIILPVLIIGILFLVSGLNKAKEHKKAKRK